ncbi:MAG: site-specific integrase [Actinomycetota bacterium]
MGGRVRWERTRYPGIYSRPSAAAGVILYRVVIQTGKRQLTKTGFPNDLKAAQAWREEHQAKKRLGGLPDYAKARSSLNSLYETVHAERAYAPATLTLHTHLWKAVAPTLGELPIVKIDRDAIETTLRAIRKPAMREKTRLLLGMLFNHAVEKRWLAVTPVPKLARPKTRHERLEQAPAKKAKRYLTEEELASLLSKMPERYRALVELMARMGLRPGEAYALTVAKFDPLRRTLTVDESVTGFTKTGLSRTLVLPAVVAESLVAHLARHSNPADPTALMFPSEDGTTVHPSNFRTRILGPAAREANLSGLRPNDLRHSAASFAIAQGANVYDVQKMLGHARPSITLDVYGELWEGSQERLAKRLDEAIRANRAPAQKTGEVLTLPAERR